MKGGATQLDKYQYIRHIFEKKKKHFYHVVRNDSISKRINKLTLLKEKILEHREDIEEALYNDLRKPKEETALAELKPVLVELNHAIKNLHKWANPEHVETPLFLLGTRSMITYQAKGVCLVIAPWNFPFNLSMGPIVSAIAAGNVVTLKPSEMAPNTALVIKDIVFELFPEEEVDVMPGDKEVAKQLLELPYNHIFFTGSPNIGKMVMREAAKHLSSVTLELGGENPCIIDRNVDIDDAAEKIVWGKFQNAGQACVAPNYILAHSDIALELQEALCLKIRKLYYHANGKLNFDAIGSIINDNHFTRVAALKNKAVENGADIVFGGKEYPEERKIEPTLLTGLDMENDLACNEIFGPLLPIIEYHNIDEVIKGLDMKRRPLSLYVFSNSSRFVKRVIEHTISGTVAINDTTLPFVHPELPFGGVNTSGIGKSHGYAGFQAFSNLRTVLRQRKGLTTLKLVFPPYTKRVKMFIEIVLKYF